MIQEPLKFGLKTTKRTIFMVGSGGEWVAIVDFGVLVVDCEVNQQGLLAASFLFSFSEAFLLPK